MLNYLDELQSDQIKTLEHHQEIDEVFVILEGQTVVTIAGNDAEAKALSFVPMEQCKTYNVKLNTWHSVIMSHETCILIFENADTGDTNSQYITLPIHLQAEIQQQARRTLLWNG